MPVYYSDDNDQEELDRLLSREPFKFEQIQQIVVRNCTTSYGDLFSGFIGVYADAMRLLGEHKRIVVTGDNGARVVEAKVTQ